MGNRLQHEIDLIEAIRGRSGNEPAAIQELQQGWYDPDGAAWEATPDRLLTDEPRAVVAERKDRVAELV